MAAVIAVGLLSTWENRAGRNDNFNLLVGKVQAVDGKVQALDHKFQALDDKTTDLAASIKTDIPRIEEKVDFLLLLKIAIMKGQVGDKTATKQVLHMMQEAFKQAGGKNC